MDVVPVSLYSDEFPVSSECCSVDVLKSRSISQRKRVEPFALYHCLLGKGMDMEVKFTLKVFPKLCPIIWKNLGFEKLGINKLSSYC
jgi:hypothetical protein